MQQSITINIEHTICRTTLDLRRKWVLRRLSKGLSCFTKKELVDLLARAGIRRSELFTTFKGNALHRQLMGRMLSHFSVDRETASEHHWPDLVYAERVCARCPNKGRCRRWFEWSVNHNAPNIFCPNAGLFHQMRLVQQRRMEARTRTYAYITDTADSEAGRVEAAWNAVRNLEEKSFWRQWLESRLDP